MFRRVRGFLFGAALAAVALVLGGCGGRSTGDGSVDPSSGGTQVDELTARALSRFCDALHACCNAANYPFDPAGCESFNRSTFLNKFSFQAATGSVFDNAAAGRCLAGITAAESACIGGVPFLNADCDVVFVGAAALGAHCDETLACARSADGQSTFCQTDASNEANHSGVCVISVSQPAHGRLGAPCDQTCLGENGLCVTSCASGSSCAGTLPPCFTSDGLFCSDAGRCAAVGKDGDPCSNASFECLSSNCNYAAQRCEELLANGVTCAHGFECKSNYCINASCVDPPLASPEFCQGRIPPPPT